MPWRRKTVAVVVLICCSSNVVVLLLNTSAYSESLQRSHCFLRSAPLYLLFEYFNYPITFIWLWLWNLDIQGKQRKVKRWKVKLSLCLTNHHVMKSYWGIGGVAPRILDLGTIWRWVVSFTPRLLYPQGKSPLSPLGRRLGGPQRQCRRGGEEKNLQPLRESNPRTPIVKPVA
jgi:hypothetical protein